MDLIDSTIITGGLAVLTDPAVYFLITIGAFLGFFFGATPGITAPAAIALVLPITYSLGMHNSLALLLGIYVSGYFAGSFPAILLNTPGTPGNAATALDGYQMSLNGDGYNALTTAIVSSFLGVLISLVLLLTMAPLMANVALKFTSVEYSSLAFLGLLCVAGVSKGSKIKGLAAALLGALISTIGLDTISGVPRYAFGITELLGGVAIIPTLIGLFAISEMLSQAEKCKQKTKIFPVSKPSSIKNVLKNHLVHKWLLLKSGLIGAFIGVLPGTGPAIASWISYGEAVRTQKPGDKYGKGEVKGLIACETSNNAVIGGAMIPLLTLGIPGDPVTAVLVGAMMIQGVEPSPFFISDHGELFISIILMLFLSNIAMAAIGFSFRKIASKVLIIPGYIIIPIVIVISATAVYAINYSIFDLVLLWVFGSLGMFLQRTGFPVAAVVLGIVLGPILETNFRNALVANNMDPMIFVTRPISAILLLMIFALCLTWFYQQKLQKRFHNSVINR